MLPLRAGGSPPGRSPARFFFPPRTADHHIQHIYGKIGVSTRAAAALWAMQNTLAY